MPVGRGLTGACQLTDRLSVVPTVAVTAGAAGAAGGSATFVTSTITVMVTVAARSVTLTARE